MSHNSNHRFALPSGAWVVREGKIYVFHGTPVRLYRAYIEQLYADSIGDDGRELQTCQSKRRYRTEAAAGQAASSARARKPDLLLRIYPCRICDGFHLTSESFADYFARVSS